MMRKIVLFAALSMLCTSCAITSVNYVPAGAPGPAVYAKATDYRLERQLDLQAVVAAFAQSATVEEFEYRINNSYDVVSNLDLNRDGYIDYLRVLETMDGYSHVFLIQAVLGYNYFQDVATIIVDNPRYNTCVVEIVGAPYIYGSACVLRPVFIRTPHIYTHLCYHSYRVWRSPWYWQHYPSHFRRCKSYAYDYYHGCVSHYMTHHSYCHQVTHRDACFHKNYDRIIHADVRNDYGTKYPERSFSVRNADTPAPGRSAVDRANAANSRHTSTRAGSSTPSSAVQNAPSTSTTRRSGSATSESRTSTVNSGTRSSATSSGSRTSTTTGSRTSSTGSTTRSSASSGSRTSSAGTSSKSSNSSASTSSSSSSSARRSSSSGSTTKSSTSSTGSSSSSTSRRSGSSTSSSSRTSSTGSRSSSTSSRTSSTSSRSSSTSSRTSSTRK